MPLPKDNNLRKALPLFTFLTEYFPDAILELVKVSVAGNLQHNPGEPMHWARGKSMDQLNTAQRHMWDYATTGPYNDEPPLPPEILAAIGGEPPMHLANAAWRLLAQIQLDCEERVAAKELRDQNSADLHVLVPDPLQPEERITGMHPVMAARFDPLFSGCLIPGRLELACGCKGYCKGGHTLPQVPVVPTGTPSPVACVPCAPYVSTAPYVHKGDPGPHPLSFDHDTVGEMDPAIERAIASEGGQGG